MNKAQVPSLLFIIGFSWFCGFFTACIIDLKMWKKYILKKLKEIK